MGRHGNIGMCELLFSNLGTVDSVGPVCISRDSPAGGVSRRFDRCLRGRVLVCTGINLVGAVDGPFIVTVSGSYFLATYCCRPLVRVFLPRDPAGHFGRAILVVVLHLTEKVPWATEEIP